MKKRLLSVLLPLGLLLIAMPVSAGLKIGSVNAARLLEEAPQAKEATSRLKQEFAPREEAMVEAGKALQKLQEKMTRDAAIMSDEERKRLGLDIMARKRELQRNQDAFREDVNIRRNDAIGQIQEIIKNGGKVMPALGDQLTDEEIVAVIRYIQTWWEPEQLRQQQARSLQYPLKQ